MAQYLEQPDISWSRWYVTVLLQTDTSMQCVFSVPFSSLLGCRKDIHPTLLTCPGHCVLYHPMDNVLDADCHDITSNANVKLLEFVIKYKFFCKCIPSTWLFDNSFKISCFDAQLSWPHTNSYALVYTVLMVSAILTVVDKGKSRLNFLFNLIPHFFRINHWSWYRVTNVSDYYYSLTSTTRIHLSI